VIRTTRFLGNLISPRNDTSLLSSHRDETKINLAFRWGLYASIYWLFLKVFRTEV
jgi:hypothetical protein